MKIAVVWQSEYNGISVDIKEGRPESIPEDMQAAFDRIEDTFPEYTHDSMYGGLCMQEEKDLIERAQKELAGVVPEGTTVVWEEDDWSS